MLKIAIMMNNYFHDLATALLITSGVTVYYFAKIAERTGSREVIQYFARSYRRLTILARAAFVWIILAGIVRIINFNRFELPDAVGKQLIPALIVKHILLFSAVGGGIYAWLKINKKVNALKKAYNLDNLEDDGISAESPDGRRITLS